jgi:hypothetical protein
VPQQVASLTPSRGPCRSRWRVYRPSRGPVPQQVASLSAVQRPFLELKRFHRTRKTRPEISQAQETLVACPRPGEFMRFFGVMGGTFCELVSSSPSGPPNTPMSRGCRTRSRRLHGELDVAARHTRPSYQDPRPIETSSTAVSRPKRAYWSTRGPQEPLTSRPPFPNKIRRRKW